MKLSPIRRVPEEASVEIITQGMHSSFLSRGLVLTLGLFLSWVWILKTSIEYI